MRLNRDLPKSSCRTCPLTALCICRSVFATGDRTGPRPLPRLRTMAAETRLQEEDEAPLVTGILRKGYLRAERYLRDGQRTVLGFFAPGDLVGDVSGSVRGPALMTATAAEICLCDPVALRRAMAMDAPLHARVLAEIMRQHTRQLEMVWRRGALSSRERIVAFLVMATEFMPVEDLPGGSLILSVVVSRRDWADYTNTTVETISRVLSQLAEQGLVEQAAQGRYHIRDLAALGHLAGLDVHRDASVMLLNETRPDGLAAQSADRDGGIAPVPAVGLWSRASTVPRRVKTATWP